MSTPVVWVALRYPPICLYKSVIGRVEAGDIWVAGSGMVVVPARANARRARRENGPAKVSIAAVLPGSRFNGK